MEDKLDDTILTTIKLIGELTPDQQYAFLYDALKTLIDMEEDPEILAIVGAQLQELSDMAISKSGLPVMPDLSRAIN